MANIAMNSVNLVARLCEDPALQYTPNGTAATTLRCAHNSGDQVLFITVHAFGPPAEAVCNYLSKGSQVAISGYLKQDRWVDKDTKKNRELIYIVSQRITFLDKPEPTPR